MKRVLILLSLILAFCVTPCYAAVYAEAVIDNKDLEVSNEEVAMSLVRSSVTNGDMEVPKNPIFQLEFSKNIAHFPILAHNSQCFHLVNREGEPVKINIIFPDTQVQSQYKRQVFISPAENLKAAHQYTLIVDNNMISKNGTPIDNAYIFTFNTTSELSSRQNRILAALGDDVMEYTAYTGRNEFSEKIYKPLVLEEESGEAEDYTAFKTVLLALALLFLISACLLQRKKCFAD